MPRDVNQIENEPLKPRRRSKTPERIRNRVYFFLLLAALIPFSPLLLVGYLLLAVILQCLIWACWGLHGRHVLLVASDSPLWRDYFNTHLVPRLPGNAVVLNWTDRRYWAWVSLAPWAFRLFNLSRHFNPSVFVFRPFRWVKTFRFGASLKKNQHGDARPLEILEKDLLEYLDKHGIGTNSTN